MSESKIQAEVFRAVGALPNVRIFRNQVGVGWLGRVIEEDKRARTVLLGNAYRVTMGLIPGSGDAIGWRSRVITPADVGKTMGQFLSLEIKTPTGVVSDEQRTWAKNVNQWGGIAIIARSASEAKYLLSS